MNRVVITGYGVASPIGNDAETFLESLQTGKNGIAPITNFDASETGITLAAEVKDFPFDKYFEKKDAKRIDKFSLFGIYAALEAMKMSNLDIEKIDVDRFGVMVGSGIGGLQTIQDQVIRMRDKGPRRVAPLFVPMSIGNIAAGNIALRVGARGICSATVTACATANNSIGEAFRNIKHGYSDVMLAGGTEASITELGIAGFASLTAVTSAENPNRASIPFDKDRSGFVMGEGAGIFVLESLEHAQERGAKILGEIVGYGSNCDAYHMTAPRPDGSGAAKAMRLAIEEAEIDTSKIGYINAHGTSTPSNDVAETKAIQMALGEASRNVRVSSTKSMTGHALGATGGMEAIATLNALQHQFIPPTINIQQLDEAIEIEIVTNKSQKHEFDYALTNSFGFGGHNAVLCLKRWED